MSILKANTFKVVFLVLLIALSLIFNQNGEFWTSVENKYVSAFFLLLSSCIIFILHPRQVKLNKIDIVVIGLLLLSVVSRSFRLGTVNEMQVLTSFALILYYLSVKTVDFKNNESFIYNAGIALVGISLSIFSLLEFYQVVLPTNFNWGMAGNFSNPGPLGGFIAVLLPLVSCELLRSNLWKPAKLLYALAAIIMVFTIVLSGSRAAMLSVIVTIAVLAGYYGSKKWKYFKYTWLALLPILAILIFSKELDSISGRFLIWKITLKSFFEKPIFGIGYDFFKTDYLNFQAAYFSLGGTDEEVLLAGASHHAFNEPLKFVVENGLFGIGVVFIGVVWILRTNKIKTFSFQQGNKINLQNLMFFGAFVTFAMFSYPLQFLPFKLVLLNQLAFQSGVPVLYSTKLSKITIPLLLLSFAFVFYAVFCQYNGVRAWKRASELQFKNPDSTSVLYGFAEKRLKYDGVFLLHYGLFNEKEDTKKALKLYEAASKTYNDLFLHFKIAELYEAFQDYDIAEKELKQQHFMQPHLFKPQEQLLDFYVRRQDTLKAKQISSKILKTPIKIESQEAFRIKQKAKALQDRL